MLSLRTPQLLFKRLIKGHPKALPILANDLSFKNLKTPFPFSKIQFYSFSSSFQQQTIRRHTEYRGEEELALLSDFEPEKLPDRKRVMEKYLQSKDLSLMNSNDIILVSDTLCCLAIAHNSAGNPDLALKYFKEDEILNHNAGIRDTIDLARRFYIQGTIYLQQNNLKDAQHYLDETKRICGLLGDNKDAKILLLHCCSSLARISLLQNDQDKAFKLYQSILARTGDIHEDELPNLILSVSEGLGVIYASRSDVEKAMEHWTKGLETAIQLFGENSEEAYSFSGQITDFLYNHGQDQRALPYAKQSLKVALQIFPKDHPEIAGNYSRLGHIEKDSTKALNSFKKAIQILEKHPPQAAASYQRNSLPGKINLKKPQLSLQKLVLPLP